MPSFTEKGSSFSTAQAAGDDAVTWAAKQFEIDPSLLNRQQPGVETLQKWLIDQGLDVMPDGLLGPSTLAALRQAYGAEQAPEETLATKMRAGDMSANATRRSAKQTAEHSPESIEEGEPGTTPEEGDKDYDPERHGETVKETVEEETSARPVALSDSAIEHVSEDRLGFTPYVEAVADFILAEQTRPPLSLAINARWGQGKTSFMNMLDGRLKEKSQDTTMRVATTWFNPWKYSEPEQVWAAFVANVTRCVRNNLTRGQSWHFKRDRFVAKMQRHADFALILRLSVALIFVLLVLTMPFTLDLPAFREAFKDKSGILGGFYAATEGLDGWLWGLIFVPFALLSVLYGYITFTKNLGLNLLEYVEKTDFKDKIGTLSQFESEMRRLADAVPEDLKIVVFIDDLDRCKGRVLGEIIEALQLADVSRTCIFVMGMDMEIVANAIESEREELVHSVGTETARMEHGSGYKFLEKIIQARLALPAHGEADMARLVSSAMGEEEPAGLPTPLPSKSVPPQGIIGTIRTMAGAGSAPQKTPSDSEAVIRTAEHYGSRHFINPRRLKRFINGFRLQTYLATSVRPGATSNERLARFLVLAEKWPALVHYMLSTGVGAQFWKQADLGQGTSSMHHEIRNLSEEELEKLTELLEGPKADTPFEYQDLKNLAAWYGFHYYPGIPK